MVWRRVYVNDLNRIPNPYILDNVFFKLCVFVFVPLATNGGNDLLLNGLFHKSDQIELSVFVYNSGRSNFLVRRFF